MAEIIVLADDEPDLRAIYAEVLRRGDYEVYEASDGAEALRMVARHRPDLLILDVWMPGVNGFEVLDQLRHDPEASTLKVVMFSNLSDGETRLEGYSGGVVDFWVKGMTVEDLLARVRRVLAPADCDANPVGDPA